MGRGIAGSPRVLHLKTGKQKKSRQAYGPAGLLNAVYSSGAGAASKLHPGSKHAPLQSLHSELGLGLVLASVFGAAGHAVAAFARRLVVGFTFFGIGFNLGFTNLVGTLGTRIG